MTGTAHIIRSNALALPLADQSVDVVVTSPPYFGLRSYTDGGEHYAGQLGAEATPAEFVDALIAATAEMVRVLKPSGSIWVNLGDCYSSKTKGSGGTGKSTLGAASGGHGMSPENLLRSQMRSQFEVRHFDMSGVRGKSLVGIPWRYALRCIDDLRLILRAEVIWSKPNGLPESVTDRVRRSHEQWFHFTAQPRYYSTVDDIRTPHTRTWSSATSNGGGTYALMASPGAKDSNLPAALPNAKGALPGSVWEVATQPLNLPAHLGVDHFAAFPMEWPRRIIRGWCPPDGTVLDPFGGTGTTALVAKMLGRTGISVDMSADYCRVAEWRTTDPGQMAAAAQVEKAEPVHPDQVAFDFDEAS